MSIGKIEGGELKNWGGRNGTEDTENTEDTEGVRQGKCTVLFSGSDMASEETPLPFYSRCYLEKFGSIEGFHQELDSGNFGFERGATANDHFDVRLVSFEALDEVCAEIKTEKIIGEDDLNTVSSHSPDLLRV